MAPKKDETRAKALAAMTKAELIKTIKALDKRQTQLLNELAATKAQLSPAPQRDERDAPPYTNAGEHVTEPPPAFPWSTSGGS